MDRHKTNRFRRLLQADVRCDAKVKAAGNCIKAASYNIFTHEDMNRIFIVLWGDDEKSCAVMRLDSKGVKDIMGSFKERDTMNRALKNEIRNIDALIAS